LFNNFNK